MGGWFGDIARGIGQAGSDIATGSILQQQLRQAREAEALRRQAVEQEIAASRQRGKLAQQEFELRKREAAQPKSVGFITVGGNTYFASYSPEKGVDLKLVPGGGIPTQDFDAFVATLPKDQQDRVRAALKLYADRGDMQAIEKLISTTLEKSTAMGSTSQIGYYKTPDGKSIPAFRDPKSGIVIDTSGNALTGGEFFGSSLLPSTSYGTSFQTVIDPSTGMPRVVQVPTTRVSQKAIPGSEPPRPSYVQSGFSALKPEPLSPQAKTAIENVRSGEQMLDQASQALSQVEAEGWPKMLYEVSRYKLRLPPDPPYDMVIPTLAYVRVILTTPYLRGLRNFNWVKMIGQHLPELTDSPKLIQDKINALRKNLPALVDAIQATEQPGLKRGAASSLKSQPSASAAPQRRPVMVNGKVVGYTTNGKTMVPVK